MLMTLSCMENQTKHCASLCAVTTWKESQRVSLECHDVTYVVAMFSFYILKYEGFLKEIFMRVSCLDLEKSTFPQVKKMYTVAKQHKWSGLKYAVL